VQLLTDYLKPNSTVSTFSVVIHLLWTEWNMRALSASLFNST